MTRVSNIDQIMALVRAQLQRMANRERAGAPGKADPGRFETMTARQRVEALAAVKSLSEDEFVRGLIRALLSEELGEGVAATPGFQSVVDRTCRAITSDVETKALIGELRRAAQTER